MTVAALGMRMLGDCPETECWPVLQATMSMEEQGDGLLVHCPVVCGEKGDLS